MAGPQRNERCLLLDWGDTVMRVFPQFSGAMCRWPRVEALPNVAEALASLHDHWQIALATNAADSQEADIGQALERVKLRPLFDRIYCFRTVGYRKPSAEFFRFILSNLGLASGQVVMVGDEFEQDVLGANAAGIPALWYNARTAEDRRGAMHDTIHDFASLAEAVAIGGRPRQGPA